MSNYLVATIKPWNIEAFHRFSPQLPGNWHLISSRDELTEALLEKLQPAMIFFPHWSWKVPDSMLQSVPCVCFHMTDLPFGRGGSPLQNLILRGLCDTKLTALQMTSELDAGPIYAKTALSLEGSAQQIFQRAAPLVYQLIEQIVTKQLQPKPQQGEVVVFERRSPLQSELPQTADANQLYDFIRMLDADTYPRAFVRHGNWTMELSSASLNANGELSAQVRFIASKTNEQSGANA
ncbi:methionyl-tRNA formyltransferase [Alkalimonas amylolytica]|uniref:Methionyl-tRNA formyltransferase n=1 Tax=Alkalimonas amylolytica TaxID=152573 RepID=A0A1H4B7R4_ALKAM|nr:methionyl-tRNA formyltransferase [Alkalimonas amylolytica]SEA44137.1 methionyl-tRNA formyltransferase [Alkalimonas amylolytica]